MEPTISIFHDTRRKKEKGVYPVKLRVYYDYQTRLYPLGIDLSKEDFERSYKAEKPRNEYKDTKIQIEALLAKANFVKQELRHFSFDKFEKKYLRPTGAGMDLIYTYNQVIKQYKEEERIKTASSYEQSIASIKKFLEAKGYKSEKLSFEEITVAFLKEYERWMLKQGRQKTTIGIYLRPLRAIFNTVIADGEVPADLYPFGKRKYLIPAGRNIKKALSKEDLKKLYEFPLPDNTLMAKARSFWFFSYLSNGINIRDLAELKYKNIDGNSLHFIRSKTKNTTKTDQKPIIAVLTVHSKQVIAMYGNSNSGPETYVFPILEPGMNETQKVRSVQLFTRFINQHIKKLAKLTGIDPDISTYWARHSYATMAIRSGASMEFVQESLGHNNLQTTNNYFKGFADSVKRDIADKLMDF